MYIYIFDIGKYKYISQVSLTGLIYIFKWRGRRREGTYGSFGAYLQPIGVLYKWFCLFAVIFPGESPWDKAMAEGKKCFVVQI